MRKGGFIKGCTLLCALVFTAGLGSQANADEASLRVEGIPPQVVADYVHAVIEADRTLYTTHVVARMQNTGVVMAAEGWKRRNALPLPAQMLLMAGRAVAGGGSGLRYRLASLWPIYEENGPANDFERTGLEVVAEDPTETYSGIIKRGDQRYFKAIYADLAVSQACVDCHNGHLLTSKRDRKVGDVMGGIIISFPLTTDED